MKNINLALTVSNNYTNESKRTSSNVSIIHNLFIESIEERQSTSTAISYEIKE